MKALLRLVLLVGLAIWAWRRFVGPTRPQERAGVSYADGSSIVLEPGSAGFEQLASIARSAIRR
ncbi:MAG TPA: hypothetical protein VFR38_08995 [Gaiellaceae bacterium]|nr:hypothetical protein [Gaiellaceae bacterium]